MSGYNLPPGVTVSMIPGNRPEDELAERIAEGWRMRCEGCGGFLKFESDFFESRYQPTRCDGRDSGGYYAPFPDCPREDEIHESHQTRAYIGVVDVHLCRRCGGANERWDY